MKKILIISILSFWAIIGVKAQIHIGDIMYSDGNDTLFVSPAEYTSGAIAVVFFVDESEEHGWAIDLHDAPGNPAWSIYQNNVPGLIDYGHPRQKAGWPGDAKGCIYDMDGYYNTKVIRESGAANNYPAAWTVDFNHGWYLPAIGQMNLLNLHLRETNASLEIAGGDPFSTNSHIWHWSSTEFANPEGYAPCAWAFKYSINFLCPMLKDRTVEEQKYMTVRAARSF